MSEEMKKLIEEMADYTDMNPWYWISYGEKCYAFAVVEAFTQKEEDPYPLPGTELQMYDQDGEIGWKGNNGTKMLINSEIANIEEQNGGTICSFIAAAHAELMKEHLLWTKSPSSEKLNSTNFCTHCGSNIVEKIGGRICCNGCGMPID